MHICGERFLQRCSVAALRTRLTEQGVALAQLSFTRLRQQDAVLEHGVDQLRALSLTTVADAIKVHQSTASRVTSSKYMLIPRGVFELEYFSLSRSPPPKVATCTVPKRRPSYQVGKRSRRIAR